MNVILFHPGSTKCKMIHIACRVRIMYQCSSSLTYLMKYWILKTHISVSLTTQASVDSVAIVGATLAGLVARSISHMKRSKL